MTFQIKSVYSGYEIRQYSSELFSDMAQEENTPMYPSHTYTTHTYKAHALSDKNWSSASLCVHEFCQDMRRASEFKTIIQRVINKSGV